MFNEFRTEMFERYNQARNYFVTNFNALIDIEHFIHDIVNECIFNNFSDFIQDYNEASYLYPFWANYPPDDRGRSPVGDQIPWIEVGEHAIGHKLSRLISNEYKIAEVGLPSGADNRFVLWAEDICRITNGFTNCAFIFLDIKSVGPRDNFDHAVISPYQVSGDGIWEREECNLSNSPMRATGARATHTFFPAISPIYILSTGDIAPTIHLFVKPVYCMLDGRHGGQPLESVENICVPNGLLLTQRPNYLDRYPGLFYPGKDDKGKDPRKIRVRVSFPLLYQIDYWRVKEFDIN